ncbi:MAG: substrate-binding domain-containing protein [Bacteroidetes bacterium]|nr:substrate-binding domain-containing protein [Bacteroidota bacterium]
MRTTFLCLVIAIVFLTMQTSVLAQGKSKIVIIPKSGESVFWKSIKMGAKLGATALSGIEIIWDAPASEDNVDQQISIFEKYAVADISGIMLSPLSQNELAPIVSKAMNKKIPVLIFDSSLKGVAGKDYICFVGINNRKAGDLAGKHLAKLLKGKGKVVLFRHVKGQANTTEREEGFLEAMAGYPNIELIEKDQYSGGTLDGANKTSKSILDKLQAADGVFCPNEPTTVGMLYTLRDAKLAGKIKFVGFDSPSVVVDALKKGEVNALIVQDPARIGYQSVKTLVDHIRGKKIPKKIDIDVQIVTKENINNQEIQKLLALPGVSD